MIFTAKQREEFLTAAQPLMSWLAANCMEGICGGPSPSTPSQESPSREQLADDIRLAITNYGEAEFAAGEWTADEDDTYADRKRRVGETAWCAEAADRIASLEAEVAALRKDAERREGVVATLQETCEIYERRLSASEPVAALATRLSAARAAHNDLLCDPKATTVQFIGSRDRLLFTWAALDSAIAAKGK